MKTHRVCRRSSVLTVTAAMLMVITAGAPPVFAANTFTVRSTADAGGTCPGTDCTLRQAIATAATNDTINFSLPANSTISLTSGQLFIDKSLTISGPGANLLNVQRAAGAGNFRIFYIFEMGGSPTVTISGLTISNGNSNSGGGISFVAGTLNVISSAISGNTAPSGGGIDIPPSSLAHVTVTNSTISGNMANGGNGGGIANGSELTIINSTIFDNRSTADGGGIFTTGSNAVTITSSTISGNSAATHGGGVVAAGNAVTVRSTIIAGNSSAPRYQDLYGSFTSQGYNFIGIGDGAAISGTTGDQIGGSASPIDPLLGPLQDNGGPTKTRALLSGSTAIDGGNSFGTSTDQRGFVRPVTIPGTSPVGDGSDIGAYEVQADQLPGCNSVNRVVNNTNDSGTDSLRAVIGNVCAGTTVTFAPNVRGAITLTSAELLFDKGLTVNGPGANLLTVQRSAASGTPVFRIVEIAANRNVTISGLTLSNGKVNNNNGGGILNAGGLTLNNAAVSGNTADLTGNGAGIYNKFGTLTINNSTISGNLVGNSFGAGSGGGIYNQGGTLTLTDSTIAGNKALAAGGGTDSGGGIITNLGKVSLTNDTISGNMADAGGGVWNVNGGSVTSTNTIIALNTAPTGPDIDGAVTSRGFNLIGDRSGATITPAQFSDQIGTAGSPLDPHLGSLQNNGGPTETLALMNNSTAVNAGNDATAPVTDQRGYGHSGVSDIGAFEFNGTLPLLKITSITHLANGHVSLQGVGIANAVHTIQVAPDPGAGSFSFLGNATSDGTGVVLFDDAGAVGLTKRFYRLTFP